MEKVKMAFLVLLMFDQFHLLTIAIDGRNLLCDILNFGIIGAKR